MRHSATSVMMPELTLEEQAALLSFARQSIERWLESGTMALARGFSPTLWRKQGVFVTLKRHGQLRGCIGHRDADLPLCQVVGAMALQAARLRARSFRQRRELAALEAEKKEIEALTQQLDELRAQAEGLTVRAAIEGRVVSRNVSSLVGTLMRQTRTSPF